MDGRERGRSFVAGAAIAAVLDNEATDARSYLPIRNENEGEKEGETLSALSSLTHFMIPTLHLFLCLSLSLLPMID